MTFEGARTVGVRQCVVLVPLPKANEPVVLQAPEGFPIWAGCMPSPCPYEWREGEFTEVPGVIVMWEERLDFFRGEDAKGPSSPEPPFIHFESEQALKSIGIDLLKTSEIFPEGL